MATIHEIKSLILSYHPVVVVETVEEERVSSLLQRAAEDLGFPLFEWSLTQGLARHGEHGGLRATEKPVAVLETLHAYEGDAIFHLKDFATHLESPVPARAFREVANRFAHTHATLFLSGGSVDLPPELDHLAVHLRLRLPDRDELRELLRSVLSSMRERMAVHVDLRPQDAAELVTALSGLTLNQARQVLAYAVIEDGRLTPDDVSKIIRRKGRLIEEGGILEVHPVEDNLYEIGGFDRLERWLDRARTGFSGAAKQLNLSPPRGVLFVGVQGCGKSLAAKVIARRWRLPLLKLDAGRLYDKYIGESEKNLRKAITIAESMSPVVLWIDEIEKAFATGGSHESDGGLSRRLLATFLTWLQEKKEEVFVVGTANDIDALPPEFLRKGRFDEIFFVDLPNDTERAEIFRIHLGLRNQTPESFDLPHLVAASEGFSGAEIEQAVVAGLYRALHQNRRLDTAILLEELSETIPLSVSRREDIEALRETARGRFVSVR